MLENQLKQLGFGKNEIKIYLSLFGLGKCKAADLIENTKLHRNIVYQSLDSLVERSLVTKTEVKNVFEYSANNPQSLVEEFENKKQLSQKIAEELAKRQTEQPREVAIYEGVEGLKKSRNKILNYQAGDEVFIFGADLNPTMERIMRGLHKKRESKGIGMRILYDQKANPVDVKWRNTLEHSVARYLPFSQAFPIWFAGIGEHLEIGIPQQDNPLIFNIRNKEAVDGFRTFFDFLWGQESYVLRGQEAVRDIWLESVDHGELRFINAQGFFVEQYPEMFKEVLNKVKQNPKYVAKNIVEPEVKGRTITKLPWMKIKYSLSGPKNPNVVWLYGNKVAISNWAEGTPVVFISTNKSLVQSYNDYFEELWRIE